MLQKSFACGGLSSLLYFNFIRFQFFQFIFIYIFKAIYCVQDSINFLCVTVTMTKFLLYKSFACGGLSSLLYFNFIKFQFFKFIFMYIIYCRLYISFTIPFIICVRL